MSSAFLSSCKLCCLFGATEARQPERSSTLHSESTKSAIGLLQLMDYRLGHGRLVILEFMLIDLQGMPMSGQSKRRFERDQEFLKELHDHVATLSPIELASWSPEARKSVTDFVGLYGAEAIALAKQTNTVLWTDDVIQAQLGTGMFGT